DRAAGEREGVHLGRIDDAEAVREELEGRVGRGLLEALADRVDELGERREAEQRHLGFDLLLELLAQADVAVDRVEVRVVGVHPGAAEDQEQRRRERRSRHDPAMLAGRTAARTSARIVLGWTATLAPAASTSSRRPPPSWPVRLSPFTSTAVAFSPPSAASTLKVVSSTVPRTVSALRSFAVSTSAPPRTCCARRRCPVRAMSAGSARVQISHPVATRCWKASVRPSGDQAGWVAGAGAVVSSIGAVPSALATQSVASALRPCAGQRENASFVPSGE